MGSNPQIGHEKKKHNRTPAIRKGRNDGTPWYTSRFSCFLPLIFQTNNQITFTDYASRWDPNSIANIRQQMGHDFHGYAKLEDSGGMGLCWGYTKCI